MDKNYTDVLHRYADLEVWEWIPGFEFCYKISNYGRVMTYKARSSGFVLLPKITPSGYWYVHLATGGGKDQPKTKAIGVSRMVATVFVDNPEDLPETDHINNEKWDNHWTNLQWTEHDYNCRKDQAYLYKVWNISDPDKVIWLESKRETERALGKSYGWLVYRMKKNGKPSRDGWVVEVKRLKGSEKKRW